MAQASEAWTWKLPLGTIARIWRAGCIIRSVFLDDISKAFGPGYNGQLAIVVTTTGTPDPKAAAAAVAKKIGATPGVVAVSPPQFDAAGNVALLSVVPAAAPDAPQTTTVVQAIRSERPSIKAATGAGYLVTGLTAANIDIAAKVSSALVPYLLTVVGLAFLLLLVVFRSVLVPLKATLGFEKLGEATDTPPKSLIRMFGPRGNPQARNLFSVLGYLQRQAGLQLHVTTGPA